MMRSEAEQRRSVAVEDRFRFRLRKAFATIFQRALEKLQERAILPQKFYGGECLWVGVVYLKQMLCRDL